MSWRVQATWTVGSDRKRYAPQFARTRLGAERLKRRMEKTLGHFATLEGLVEKAGDELAERSSPAGLPEAVHLVALPDATTTACGRPTVEVDAFAGPAAFALSRKPCEVCAAAC